MQSTTRSTTRRLRGRLRDRSRSGHRTPAAPAAAAHARVARCRRWPGRGAAGRAARRGPPSGPQALRRLVPQALVVAFLAGGTSAFVAEDKAIELSVDGKPRTLHTFADDVTELLADEGVAVGAHDVVAPAPGTRADQRRRGRRPLRAAPCASPSTASGARCGRRRARWTGRCGSSGCVRRARTCPAARSRRIGRTGSTLDVRTERTVTVMADGRARTVRTNAATVREAVEEAGITLRGQDTTSVPPGSFPRDGQTVTVLRITAHEEVREEADPVRRARARRTPRCSGAPRSSSGRGSRGCGASPTPSARSTGCAEPRRLGTEVVREPRTQVVKVGTKPLPTSVPGADGLNWQRARGTASPGGGPTRSTPPARTAASTSSTPGPGRASAAPAAPRTRPPRNRPSGRRSCMCGGGRVLGRTAGPAAG